MTPVYSPDCDCGLVTSLVPKEVYADHKGACLAFLRGVETFAASQTGELPRTARYFCVHGPGGHVISVKP